MSKMPTLSKKSLFLLLGLSLLQLSLFLWHLDRESLWLDEALSYVISGGSWKYLFAFFRSIPIQHPVYYVLLHPWLHIHQSVFSLRAFSVVWAWASLWIFFRLGLNLVGERVTRIASVLFALSPFLLYFAQEGRMYSLLTFLALLNTHYLLGLGSEGGTTAKWKYFLSSLVGVFTHLYFCFFLGAQFLYFAYQDRLGKTFARIFKIQAIVFFFYLPLALYCLTIQEDQPWKGKEYLLTGVPYAFLRFCIGYSQILANAHWKENIGLLLKQNISVLLLSFSAFFPTFLAGIIFLRRSGKSGGLIGSLLFGPMLIAVILSTVKMLFGERYLIFCYPFFALTLAGGLTQLWFGNPSTEDRHFFFGARSGKFAAAILAILLAASQFWSLERYYFDPSFGKEQWHEVIQNIRRSGVPGDVILLNSDISRTILQEGQLPFPILRAEAFQAEDLKQARRAWVVISHGRNETQFLHLLRSDWHFTRDEFFPKQSGIRLLLLER